MRRFLPFELAVAGVLSLTACGISAVGEEPEDLPDGGDATAPTTEAGSDASAEASSLADGQTTNDATNETDADPQDAGFEASADADASDADAAAPDADAAPPTATLTVTMTTPSAAVTSDVGGIDCPSNCLATVPIGTTVTLTANGGNDFSLTGWSEPACGRALTCPIKVEASRTVTATFAAHVSYMHTPSALYSVRTSDGAATKIADFKSCGGSIYDLAIDRTGKAFVVTSAPSALYALDLANATCTAKKGDLGVGVNSLSFAPDPSAPGADALYAASYDTTLLYRVDVANGKATSAFDMGSNHNASGDLVWHPAAGFFIALAPSGGTDRLGRIDLKAKTVTIVGQIGKSNVWALGWRGTQLIGFSGTSSFLINPTSAATTAFGTIPDSAYGAASGP